jgi:formylglycine-generating enzyme required for sulfatase activity
MDAYEGFFTHPWYEDFSLPTFDGKHNLIKGGSWISTGNEIMRESRYAFRRHFIQHAGFRYVIGDGENEAEKYGRIEKMFDAWKKRYG